MKSNMHSVSCIFQKLIYLKETAELDSWWQITTDQLFWHTYMPPSQLLRSQINSRHEVMTQWVRDDLEVILDPPRTQWMLVKWGPKIDHYNALWLHALRQSVRPQTTLWFCGQNGVSEGCQTDDLVAAQKYEFEGWGMEGRQTRGDEGLS